MLPGLLLGIGITIMAVMVMHAPKRLLLLATILIVGVIQPQWLLNLSFIGGCLFVLMSYLKPKTPPSSGYNTRN